MNNVSSGHERCRFAICHDFVLQNRRDCASIQIRISSWSWSTPTLTGVGGRGTIRLLRILRDSIIEFLHIIRSQGESMAKELSLAQAEDLEVLLESLKGDSERYLGQMGACQKRQFFVAQSFDTGFDKQLLTKLRK